MQVQFHALLSRNIDSRQILTYLESKSIFGFVLKRTQDIVAALKFQLVADRKEIDRTYKEMSKLHAPYVKYRSLEARGKQLQEHIANTLALLGQKGDSKHSLPNSEFATIAVHSGIAETSEELRKRLPLWMLIAEILRHVSEIQVINLEEVLYWLRIKVSRQAIESAFETHGDLFKVKKRGREKFVSLK